MSREIAKKKKKKKQKMTRPHVLPFFRISLTTRELSVEPAFGLFCVVYAALWDRFLVSRISNHLATYDTKGFSRAMYKIQLYEKIIGS